MWFQTRLHPAIVCAATFVMWCFVRCSPISPTTDGYPNQTAMLGQTRDTVLLCAGPPLREAQRGDITELLYYREAPMLEESGIVSKGSRPGVHHGCWATVILKAHRVEEVRYRYVPDFFDASNDCEDIFAACLR